MNRGSALNEVGEYLFRRGLKEICQKVRDHSVVWDQRFHVLIDSNWHLSNGYWESPNQDARPNNYENSAFWDHLRCAQSNGIFGDVIFSIANSPTAHIFGR